MNESEYTKIRWLAEKGVILVLVLFGRKRTRYLHLTLCISLLSFFSDIFDAMFAAKANAGDVIIQQGLFSVD